MKQCRNCKNKLRHSRFVKDNRYKDGYQNRCKECQSKYDSIRYETNRETILTKQHLYINKNIERVRERNRNWIKVNKKRFAKYLKSYVKENIGKERAGVRKYFVARLRASPVQLSESHLKEIELIYHSCPNGFHVDHIVPLQGKNVSGLHVPWNLQYLTASDNIRKSNKY